MNLSNHFQPTPDDLYTILIEKLSQSQRDMLWIGKIDDTFPAEVQWTLVHTPALLRTLLHDCLLVNITDRLCEADRILFANNLTARLELVGGSALILHRIISLSTRDIDTVTKLDQIVREILLPFDINNNARNVSVLHPSYSSRLCHTPNSYNALDIYLVHPVDVFLLKLQRLTPKDGEDIESLLTSFTSEDKKVALTIGIEMCTYMPSSFVANFSYYKRFLL